MKKILLSVMLVLLSTSVFAKPEFAPIHEAVVCPAEECLYTYNAEVVRWVDGDTVELTIDLGFTITVTQHFRLYDTAMYIDTPERGQKGYKEATAVANGVYPPGSTVIVQTGSGSGKYGRYLVYLPKVNTALLESGWLKDPHRYD